MTEESMSPVEAAPASASSPGLLAIGAAVIVAVWLIFDLIAGEWGPGTLYTALAAIVILSTYKVGGMSVGRQALKVIGYLMGLVAVIFILTDIRYSAFPDGAMDIIAYLLFLAGALMMFVGARSLND